MKTMLVLLLALLALLLGVGNATSARSEGARCTGAQLAGSFTVVRGSGAAGSITYALVLRNRSTTECTLTGLPAVRLLGKTGKALPTHVLAGNPGALTAVLVRLAPGERTRATARFSPDVPGVGEPTQGTRCEPVAYKLRVSGQGGGTATVPISPPTSVCEHGQLRFTAYGTTG